MASPQKENGHTQIANELFEAILKSNFTLRELKIIFVVIRFTYGFNRKEAELSARFISNATGIKFYHVSNSINDLHKKNVLFFSDSKTHSQGRRIKLNKDYDSWNFNSSQKRNSSRKRNGTVPKKGTETVPETGTKKDNKENLKTWFESFWKEYPNKKAKIKAEGIFLKKCRDEKLFAEIMTALNNQKQTEQWQKDNGKFIPHPSTWLNQERWKDEIEQPKEQILKLG